jgi:hypothetical protein
MVVKVVGMLVATPAAKLVGWYPRALWPTHGAASLVVRAAVSLAAVIFFGAKAHGGMHGQGDIK